MKVSFRPILSTVTLRHGPESPEGLEGAALAEWEATNVQKITISVRPLPVGRADLIGAWIPDAPKRPKLSSTGKEITGASGPVMADADPAEQALRNMARTMARMGAQVVDVFDTPYPPDGAPLAAWLAYSAALQAEMVAASFTPGDVTALIVAMYDVNSGGGSLGNS